MERQCTQCKEIKPQTDFYKDKYNLSGFRSDCKNCGRIANTEYVRKNRESINLRKRQQYQENPLKQIQRNRQYRATPLGRAKRRLDHSWEKIGRRKQMPKWADFKAIKQFYLNCPPDHHVDHIIPLKGKTISGLHVLNNLQYLPAKLNLQKSNRIQTPIIGY